MLSLADTTALLDETTTQLKGETDSLTPQVGVSLINSWLDSLKAGENTQSLAEQLAVLKTLLATTPLDKPAITQAMNPVADQLSLFATQMGGEGEMPALLEGLAVALRQAADSSKADTVS